MRGIETLRWSGACLNISFGAMDSLDRIDCGMSTLKAVNHFHDVIRYCEPGRGRGEGAV